MAETSGTFLFNHFLDKIPHDVYFLSPYGFFSFNAVWGVVVKQIIIPVHW